VNCAAEIIHGGSNIIDQKNERFFYPYSSKLTLLIFPTFWFIVLVFTFSSVLPWGLVWWVDAKKLLGGVGAHQRIWWLQWERTQSFSFWPNYFSCNHICFDVGRPFYVDCVDPSSHTSPVSFVTSCYFASIAFKTRRIQSLVQKC
jgi:hypothetical protein